MIVNVTSGALQWILRIPIYYFLNFATRLGHHLQREYDILYDVAGGYATSLQKSGNNILEYVKAIIALLK